MLSFIIWCIFIAVIVSVGMFFINLIIGFIAIAFSLVFSSIAWIARKVTGKES
jgi:hypothetical protein